MSLDEQIGTGSKPGAPNQTGPGVAGAGEVGPDGGRGDLPAHILRELGFSVWRVGDELHGDAVVTPHMHVPGTDHLRAAVLAAWSDTVTGLLAASSMGGRVPVTLALDVHLDRPAPAEGRVTTQARVVKKGRSVFVASADFAVDGGEPFAVSIGSFMLAPDPDVRLPENLSIGMSRSEIVLTMPLAERAGIVRRSPGVVELARSEDGLNSSNTVNGGLIALATEEAALSLAPGRTLSSLGLHYLQPVRVGPIVAEASARGELGRVELRDAGADARLSVLATTRVF